jgi:hypothetical protein
MHNFINEMISQTIGDINGDTGIEVIKEIINWVTNRDKLQICQNPT